MSRLPASALPTISSETPWLYTSAVSMKLIPASSAVSIMRAQSSGSRLPHGPNIIAPRQYGLTLTPVRPSVRSCIALPPLGNGVNQLAVLFVALGLVVLPKVLEMGIGLAFGHAAPPFLAKQVM